MLSAYTYRLPFKKPFKNSGRQFTHREGVIIVYKDGDIEAFGDIAPLPGYSKETLEQVKEVLKVNQAYLQESISKGNGNEALRLLDQIHGFPSLSFGLDTLLHDLEAKQNQKPLAEWLFKDFNPSIACNATLPILKGTELIEQAQRNIDQGYQTLKVKVGLDFTKELKLLSELRKRYPDIAIRIDANQSWSVDEAIMNLNALSSLNIEYCEQPVSADNIEGLKSVRDAVNIPIAADESIRNKRRATELSVNKIVDILVLKPMLLGTFENIFVTNEIADTHNLETVYTTSLESAIGRASTAAISAGLKKANRAQGLGTGLLFQNDVSTDSWLNESKIQFPDSSGLGISLHLEDLKKLF